VLVDCTCRSTNKSKLLIGVLVDCTCRSTNKSKLLWKVSWVDRVLLRVINHAPLITPIALDVSKSYDSRSIVKSIIIRKIHKVILYERLAHLGWTFFKIKTRVLGFISF